VISDQQNRLINGEEKLSFVIILCLAQTAKHSDCKKVPAVQKVALMAQLYFSLNGKAS